MIDKLTTAIPTGAAPLATPSPAPASSCAAIASPAPASSTRLYVEQQGDRYVYRVVDVATGRVLLEAPREDADRLKSLVADVGTPLVSTTA